MTKTKVVQVNARGRRIGESHPRAKLSDHEIELIRELAEERMPHREIAAKFDVSVDTVKSYTSYRRRGQQAARLKRVAA